ncbi:MAG TPA: hypothetical protein DCS43_02075 [Verrucomicrobia bacterium]|nr:hypothetical protein [Verrucomicrobiota bacterium]
MQTGENPPLILLGASTGGPPAISEVLENLGTGTRAAVVIVQHLDARFSNGLAVWLSEQPNVMPVALAAEGMRPTAGRALLTASNDHLTMRQDLTLAYDPEPRDYPYRPSVDVLFHAASRYWPTLGAAALLTGMGRDGAQGLLALRQAGWLTLAQDEASSALYGMPKAAADIGAASEILAPREIGLRLVRWSLSNAAMQRSKGSNHERTKRT